MAHVREEVALGAAGSFRRRNAGVQATDHGLQRYHQTVGILRGQRDRRRQVARRNPIREAARVLRIAAELAPEAAHDVVGYQYQCADDQQGAADRGPDDSSNPGPAGVERCREVLAGPLRRGLDRVFDHPVAHLHPGHGDGRVGALVQNHPRRTRGQFQILIEFRAKAVCIDGSAAERCQSIRVHAEFFGARADLGDFRDVALGHRGEQPIDHRLELAFQPLCEVDGRVAQPAEVGDLLRRLRAQ